MYFEPLISVKCCPKLHIKQFRNNLHYICLELAVLVLCADCEIGLGGGVTDEKGGPGKGEGKDLLSPSLDTPMRNTTTQPVMPEMRLEPMNVCLTDRLPKANVTPQLLLV